MKRTIADVEAKCFGHELADRDDAPRAHFWGDPTVDDFVEDFALFDGLFDECEHIVKFRKQ